MAGQHELAELAPRDVVAKAIVRQMAATGSDHVFLDARHLGRTFLAERFPTISAALAQNGFDLAEDLVPVAPAQHYHSGGVRVDLAGRSTLAALYAVGEVSCTGVHGANRLASNSLLEGLVFAHRIADDLTARVEAGDLPRVDPVDRDGSSALVAGSRRPRVQQAATSGPGVIRDDAGLRLAAAVLARVSTQHAPPTPSTAEWETTNLHQVASLLTLAATLREETRGGHYRHDHPDADDARWRGRTHLRLAPDGTVGTRFVPL